jgi:hypothetical protein
MSFPKRLILIFLLIFMLGQYNFGRVPQTYYVANNGNDSNNGTAKGTPFATAPTMDCGSGWNGVTLQPGDTVVFKGGDTWSAPACMGWAPNFSGSAGNYITLTTDHTWFTGGSYTRPIFDMAYMTSFGLELLNVSYININDIEFKRTFAVTMYKDWSGMIFHYHDHHINVSNLYMHGWQLQGSGPRADGKHGAMINFFDSGNRADALTLTATDCIIENSENAGSYTSTGLAMYGIGIATRVTIHDAASAMMFSQDWNYGLQYNIATGGHVSPDFANEHSNGTYVDPQTLGQVIGWIRNSIFHDCSSNCNMAYPNIRGSATVEVYNNIFYGNIPSVGPIHVDPFQACSDGAGTPPCEGPGNVKIYNNLCDITTTEEAPHECIRVGDRSSVGDYVNNLEQFNNHVIGAADAVMISRPDLVHGTYSHGSELVQTTAVATAEGFTIGNLFVPQNCSNSEYRAGTDKSATFTTDILNVTRTFWDIGPYFKSTCGAAGSTSKVHLGHKH